MEKCTLVDDAFATGSSVATESSTITGLSISDTDSSKEDGVYNYSRVFCHFGALLLEFRDGWGEGDGERVHGTVLEAVNALFQGSWTYKVCLETSDAATLFPNLAYQVMHVEQIRQCEGGTWKEHSLRPPQ